ncbi:transposase [Arthrobacter sp. ISL-30]|nr:transposase [Arthrobacter sp. ISL-30]
MMVFMAKSFRPVLRDQGFLLPVDMREWLPPDHLAWFLIDTIEALDTTGLEKSRKVGGAGAAGYDPRMLLALLMYAYCRGVRSSRQIERLCSTDVAFRVLCAQDGPDHCTIARFRSDCQDAFEDLFAQVLLVAARAGLARFGTVAIDGTKISANASIDANRSQEWLQQKVREMVAEAEAADAAEDAARSTDDVLEDRVPPGLADPSGRQARIRAAVKEIAEQARRRKTDEAAREDAALARRRRSEEGKPVVGRIPEGPHRLAEAEAHLAREIGMHQAKLDRYAGLLAAGKKPMGRPPVPLDESTRVRRAERVVKAARAAQQQREGSDVNAGTKMPSAVANTTDPQSRIMPTRRGFLQGYNAQVAVTGDHLIVAVSLGQSTSDLRCLVPMMRAAQDAATRCHETTGSPVHRIGTVLADAGYASNANLGAPGPDRLIALGKGRDQAKAAATEKMDGPPPEGATPRQSMAHRLRTEEGHSLYKRRGATVEPTVGNLKKILDRFSRRGLKQAASELHLAATAHNLMKLHRAQAA